MLKKRGIKSAEFDFKNIKFVVIMSINNTLSSIELKVSKLVESYTELKKIINISKTVDVSSDDIKNTRMKINSYVREIDKCIALLNS